MGSLLCWTMQKRRWFLETLLATPNLLRLYIENILPLIYIVNCSRFKKHLRLRGSLMYCTRALSLIHWKIFAVLINAHENCKTLEWFTIYGTYVCSNFSMLELLEISNYSSNLFCIFSTYKIYFTTKNKLITVVKSEGQVIMSYY